VRPNSNGGAPLQRVREFSYRDGFHAGNLLYGRPPSQPDFWLSVFSRAPLFDLPPQKSASTSASKTRLVGVKLS
jgi:hypothetical protein